MPLDPASDVLGADLIRLLSLYSPPEYVKTASEVNLKGRPNDPPHAFADPTARTYPIGSSASTWLSATYFHDKAAFENPRPDIAQRIDEAARFWGIARDVKIVRDKAAAMRAERPEVNDDDFAWVFEGAPRMPVRNRLETKVAADWLVDNRDAFLFGDRKRIAQRVLAAADRHGCELGASGGTLEKMAGLGTCAASHAGRLLQSRIDVLAGKKAFGMAGMLKSAADELIATDSPGVEPALLDKIATLVDRCDRVIGLRYESGVERAEDVLFAITEKVANDYRNSRITTVNGAVYDVNAIAKLSLVDCEDALGTDLATKLGDGLWIDTEKVAEALPNLTIIEADAFERFAAQAGVTPMMRLPVGRSVGLDTLAAALA